jgi:penicillin-binding protein 1C
MSAAGMLSRWRQGVAARRRWFGAAALVLLVLAGIRLWPHAPLKNAVLSSTAIYARDGQLLRLALAPDEQYRLWTPLAGIDPRLPEAVLLYEDRWFYWHAGFNPVALLRAAFVSMDGEGRRGASTISMQLVRRLHRMQTQSVGGKLRQIAAALWLEARYGKREILEAYLNLAPYGGNIEGVGAASLIYFHKRASALTLPEVLTLAVMPQNPNKRGGAGPSGTVKPALAAARLRLWQAWVQRHPDAARNQPDMQAATALSSSSRLPFRAPHLTDWLLRERRGGEIWSSLDMPLQTTLERVMAQYVDNHRGLGVSNAAAMLIERDSGEVRALVGSVDYHNAAIDGQVNGAEAKRSPGSTLKPFIYALGLDQGLLHPMTILKDAPTAFGPFSPENFDGRFVGPISAQDALVRSRNIPAVSVASRLNKPGLYEFLKHAGVAKLASEQHYGLALTLGGGELTMEELGRLYLMLANQGRLTPLAYEKQSAPAPPGAPLLSEEAAYITLQMLRANPRPDSGMPAVPPVAWKTGTSWGFRDAWSAGVFGRHVLLVWVGNFDGSGNPAFIGVKTAAPLFFRIVDSIRGQGLDAGAAETPAPANATRIEVCSASGDLPNHLCKDLAWSWFIPGKSPIKVSTLHRALKIDGRSGRATCEDGPHVRTEVFEFWPSDLQRLFREAGMPRRQPPAVPDCSASAAEQAGDAPLITAPGSDGMTYTLRLSKPAPIALRANSITADESLFWFANGGLVGKSRAGESTGWMPAAPGRYQLRVIDRQGRADVRAVEVEFVP